MVWPQGSTHADRIGTVKDAYLRTNLVDGVAAGKHADRIDTVKDVLKALQISGKGRVYIGQGLPAALSHEQTK
eukprot:1140952-Pelagomonas_calceolata.AAC.3